MKNKIIFTSKLILSLFSSYVVFELYSGICTVVDFKISSSALFALLVFMLLLLNIAIWVKNTKKKLFFGATFIFATAVFSIFTIKQLNLKSDYCLEDGDCGLGRVVIVDNKEITINEKTCTTNNWIWHERSQTCKISMGKFKVEKFKVNREE